MTLAVGIEATMLQYFIATRASGRGGQTPAEVGIGPASSYNDGRFSIVDGFTVTIATNILITNARSLRP